MNHNKFNYARFDEQPKVIQDKDVDVRSLRKKPASPPNFEYFEECREEFNRLKKLGSWCTEEQRLRLGDHFITLSLTFADPAYEWDRSQDEDVVQAAGDAFRRYQAWARAEEQKSK